MPTRPAGGTESDLETWIDLLDRFATPMGLLDRKGRLIAANAAWRAETPPFCLSGERFPVGCDYPARCREEHREIDGEAFRDVLDGRRGSFVAEYECTHRTPVRRCRMTVLPGRPDSPAAGLVCHTSIEGRDLSEELMGSFFRPEEDLVCIATDDGFFRHVSPAFETTLGYRSRELLEQPFLDLVHPEDRRATLRALRELSQKRAVAGFRNRCRCRDGRYLWLEWRSRAAESGSIYAIARDVTDARRVERAAAELSALLRAAIDASPAGILVAEAPDGRIRIANAAALSVRGGDPAGLIDVPLERHAECWGFAHPDGALVAPHDLPLARALLRGETSRGVELAIRHEDTDTRWVLANAAPVRDERGTVTAAVMVFTDITARVEAEKDRRLFEALLGATTDFVGVADHDTHALLHLNPAARRMYGVGPDEPLDGLGIRDFHPPAEYERICDAIIPHALEHGSWSGETSLRRHDGREVPVSLVLIVHKDADGHPHLISGVMRDLTEHKKLEAQLLQSQKMESIGRLAGGVAHDFNNLLTVILGATETLLARGGHDMRADALLNDIRRAGDRAASLTSQLLAFGRRQLAEPQTLDVKRELAEIRKMLRRLLPAGISIEVRSCREPCTVHIDPGQFQQVLVNLAVNARDAMRNGGRLEIEAEAVEFSGHGTADPLRGEYVEIAVRDTGEGIDPEILPHVFEPFFTTKGIGTGLGLATCHGIVTQNGGEIRIESSRDKGTTVRVYLPRSAGEPAAVAAPGRTAAATSGRETILFVEDDDMVRQLGVVGLRTKGFRVLAAASGGEALDALAGHDGPLDLLITDVVLPDLSGREVADRVRESRPGIEVLFTSGYAEDMLEDRGVAGEGHRFLQKPYTPDTLADRVRGLLDAHHAGG